MMKVNVRATQRCGACACVPVRQILSTRIVCRARHVDDTQYENQNFDRRAAMLSIVAGLSVVGGDVSPALAQGRLCFFRNQRVVDFVT